MDEKKLFIRKLHPEVRGMFEGLAPHMSFPMRLCFESVVIFRFVDSDYPKDECSCWRNVRYGMHV